MQNSWNLSEQELQELLDILPSDQTILLPSDISIPSDYSQNSASHIDHAGVFPTSSMHAGTTNYVPDLLSWWTAASSDQAFIPSDITIPSDYPQNAASYLDNAGMPSTSSVHGGATSYVPDSSDLLSWWAAVNGDLSLASTLENDEPSPARSSAFTNPPSSSRYQRESSSFEAQPIQNNFFPSSWDDFDDPNCDDIPTHISPSLIMDFMTFPSLINSTCDMKDNPANEPNPLRVFKGFSSPSRNPQNNADTVGGLDAYNQPMFELSNYVPIMTPQTDPIRNRPFLDGNTAHPALPIAGPSTGNNTMYAPNQMGASSSREQKRPRADTWEDEPPRHTTKRQRKADSAEHREGRRYPCPNPRCPLTFSRANDAKRHAKSFHDEARFTCDVSDACSEYYHRRDSLHRHKRIVHDIHHDGCRCRKCRNVPPRE